MAFSSDSIQRGLSSSLSDSKNSSGALASGKKTLNAADLAVVSALTNEATQYSKASENIDYGSSVSNIQDSFYSSASAIFSRIGELAAQSANGTISDSQRSSISQETEQLQQEVSRQAASAEFNGINVLDNSITIQAGIDGGQDSQLQISPGNLSEVLNNVITSSVDTQGQAAATLDIVGGGISGISQQQSLIGANQSRLSYAQSAASSAQLERTSASARIENADIAEEAAKKTSADIRTQINTALLAQVNKQSTGNVSNLLR